VPPTFWSLAMPLSKSHNKKAITRNMATLLDEYRRDGQVSGQAPANRAEAVRQALAIATRKRGAGRIRPETRRSHLPRRPLDA